MLTEGAAVVGRGPSQPVLIDGLADPPVPLVGGGQVEMNARPVAGEGQGLGEGHLRLTESVQLEIDQAEVEENGGVLGGVSGQFPEHFLRAFQATLLEVQDAQEAQHRHITGFEQVRLGQVLFREVRFPLRQKCAGPLKVGFEETGGER